MIGFHKLTGFQWDNGNVEKNWLKHGVTNAESEQVFFNDPLVIAEPLGQIWAEMRSTRTVKRMKDANSSLCLQFGKNLFASFLPEI